jgi:hypothetical protein
VGARLYVHAECSADRVLKSRCRRELIRVRDCSRRAGLRAVGDLCLEVAHGPIAVGGATGELTSAVVVGFGEERFAVALRELPVVHQFDCLVGQFEQPERVGEVAAASSEPAGEVGAGDAQVVEEGCDGAGFFDDGEVGAGDVLDQGELERDGVVGTVVNEAGIVSSSAMWEARQRRSPAISS